MPKKMESLLRSIPLILFIFKFLYYFLLDAPSVAVNQVDNTAPAAGLMFK